MKKYVLIILCCISSLSVSAQVDSFHKGTTMFITGGVSIPGSEFAEATGIEVKNYVNKGVYTAFGFKIDAFRHFAVGATGGYTKNSLNIQAIEEATSTEIETTPWTSSFLLADFYAQLPVKKWTVYLKGSVGAMFPNNWEFYAKQENSNGSTLDGTTKTAEKIEPAYLTGLGLNYIANRFVIGIESNVLAYKPEFLIDLNGSPGTKKQWIATLNQTVSLGYKF